MRDIYTPMSLLPGDLVGVIAPSALPDISLLQAGCEVIRSWGLRVQQGRHTDNARGGYLAAIDAERLADIQHMLDNPDIKAVCCARGGYGITRIIDRIDFSVFLRRPKWIVGFSDVTAIHLKTHQLGIESIHACMPVQFAAPQYGESVDRLRHLLLTPTPLSIKAPPHTLNKKGRVQGQVIGGNLSLLADALGTPTAPDTEGKILILEDVGEPLYRIDRMLTQLNRAGKLNNLAGLVLGHFTAMQPTKPPFGETVQQMIIRQTCDTSYPVAFGFPTGHAAPNMPWRYSAHAEYEVTDHGAELRFRP